MEREEGALRRRGEGGSSELLAERGETGAEILKSETLVRRPAGCCDEVPDVPLKFQVGGVYALHVTFVPEVIGGAEGPAEAAACCSPIMRKEPNDEVKVGVDP